MQHPTPDPCSTQQTPRTALGTRLLGLLESLESRLERRRQRRALLTLDDRLLKDIGISRGEALTQGEKPLWRD
jgi:uncharacterized protein YjiS (DUF1127 family)